MDTITRLLRGPIFCKSFSKRTLYQLYVCKTGAMSGCGLRSNITTRAYRIDASGQSLRIPAVPPVTESSYTQSILLVKCLQLIFGQIDVFIEAPNMEVVRSKEHNKDVVEEEKGLQFLRWPTDS